MDIYLKKRHLFMIFMLMVAFYLVVSGGKQLYKMAKAQDLTSLNEFTKGDYVNLSFNRALYLEYEDLHGKKQKNYSVCGTLTGEVYFVNALSHKYVLIEVGDEKMIEDITSGSENVKELFGVIQNNSYDATDFKDVWQSVTELEDTILIKEVDYAGLYRLMVWNGILIIIFCIVIFFATGGVESILY